MLLAAARRPVLNFQRTAGVDFDMCCNAFQFNYYSIYITNILGRFRSSASFAPVHPADPAVGATPSTLREGATPSCTCCLWSLVLLFPYLDSQIEIIIKISRFMKHVWNVKFLIQTHWNVIVSIYIYIYSAHGSHRYKYICVRGELDILYDELAFVPCSLLHYSAILSGSWLWKHPILSWSAWLCQNQRHQLQRRQIFSG